MRTSFFQKRQGPLLALASALLFGVSPVLVKTIMGEMSPILLAGLLYFGSGAALVLLLLFQRKPILSELQRLSPTHRWKFLGALLAGGILAPLCLTCGIQMGSAFEVAVLLSLEPVATTVLAVLIFREHVSSSVWIGLALLLVGGLIIAVNPASPVGISAAGLLILGSCLFWGIDNNLTRDIEDISPKVFAGVKGVIAGTFNILLAMMSSAPSAGGFSAFQIGATLLIGAISYGVSLVFFIEALRSMGSSRTSVYFSVGPFFGMVFAVLLLGDRPYFYQWGASIVMAVGLWVLYKESHEHWHRHDPVEHRHSHVHDEHHRHSHEGETLLVPHDHLHTHGAHEHSHAHSPDIHRRHIH